MNNPVTIENETGAIVSQHELEAQKTLAEAKAYYIDCPELAEAAAEDLGAIKAKMKQLNDQRMGMTRPLDEAKARIIDLFRRPLFLLEQAETALKASIVDWNKREQVRLVEERRKQQEAARLAQEALEAQQRAEQQAVDAKRQEALRIQQEADAAAKEAAVSGDDEAMRKAEEQLASASVQVMVADAEAAAQKDIAAVESEALAAMLPAVAAAPEKLAGVSVRKNYKAEVVDLMALVKAVAAGEASIELLQANMAEINKRAKALKLEFKAPGVRVYAEDTVAAKARGL